MASLPPEEEYRALVKRIQSSNYFLNRQLQHICQINSMSNRGVKADLQKRIIEALHKAFADGDAQTYRELEQSIHREKQGPTPSHPYVAHPPQPAPQPHASSSAGGLHVPFGQPAINNTLGTMNGYPHANGHRAFGLGGPNGNGMRAQAQAQPVSGMFPAFPFPLLLPPFVHSPPPVQQLSQCRQEGPVFRHSPFYQVVERIGDVRACEMMASHRNTVHIKIKAQDYPLLSQCRNDKFLRVMVFCAAADYGTQEITFPHQSELKVNGDEVKANLRGLKNKPGSTRPADITDLLRLRLPQYTNNVEFTYALTTKAGDKASTTSQRYFLVINICKEAPVDSLVRHITSRKISKASVIAELTKKANDAEIELSSQVLSLKCPLSYMRLVTPVRATTCTHVQCFDATSYLQLQQQGPQWVCPVCSKPAPYERLAIDEYVRDILDNTSKAVEQVDIQPTGVWKAHGPVEDEVKPETKYDAFDLLDDDDFEISSVSLTGRNANTPTSLAPTLANPTPAAGASREGSSMPRPGGTKRTHEVIDLTLSDDDDDDDDDDEPPQRPQKRQQFSHPGSRGHLPSDF